MVKRKSRVQTAAWTGFRQKAPHRHAMNVSKTWGRPKSCVNMESDGMPLGCFEMTLSHVMKAMHHLAISLRA